MIKNYKLFILIHLFIFLIFSSVYSFFVLNYKKLYMNSEFPMWENVKNVKNNKFNTIFIGDSRLKAGLKPLIFDYNTISSINLAVGGGTPIEGYYTLKNYLKNNKKPKYLLLSYAPFHLVSQDTFWKRTVRFNFLEDNLLEEVIDKGNTIENNNETLGNSEKLISFKFNTSKYFIEFIKGILYRRWIDNKRISEELVVSKGHYIFGSSDFSAGLNEEAWMNEFVPSILLNYYFEELLKLANQNNIIIFYYSMPFNESSYKKINKEFKYSYDDYINDLSIIYNIKLLNKLYYLPNENFGDASHLYKGIDNVSMDIRNKFKLFVE